MVGAMVGAMVGMTVGMTVGMGVPCSTVLPKRTSHRMVVPSSPPPFSVRTPLVQSQVARVRPRVRPVTARWKPPLKAAAEIAGHERLGAQGGRRGGGTKSQAHRKTSAQHSLRSIGRGESRLRLGIAGRCLNVSQE